MGHTVQPHPKKERSLAGANSGLSPWHRSPPSRPSPAQSRKRPIAVCNWRGRPSPRVNGDHFLKAGPFRTAVQIDGHRRGLLSKRPLPPQGLHKLERSLKKHWKWYRRELDHCQIGFSEEAVHDFRVETRRLLSLVEL